RLEAGAPTRAVLLIAVAFPRAGVLAPGRLLVMPLARGRPPVSMLVPALGRSPVSALVRTVARVLRWVLAHHGVAHEGDEPVAARYVAVQRHRGEAEPVGHLAHRQAVEP